MDKLGTPIKPTEVGDGGCQAQHAVWSGVELVGHVHYWLYIHVVCSLACYVGWREQHAAECIARRADSDADDIGVPVGQPAAVPAAANRRESLWHVIQPRQQLVEHELHLVLPISGWGREQPVPL